LPRFLARISEAVARRLALVVDLPTPDIPMRRAIWERTKPASVTLMPDVDLEALAKK
jgi:hypothetical protein